MANPQTENGYTSIANELIEAMYKHDFGWSKGQVFMAIIRLTYGWHKKEDAISLSRLCELTKLSKRTIIYTLQNLETQKKICITRSSSNGVKNINTISIQKNYELWNDNSFALPYLKLKNEAKLRSAKLRSSAKLSKMVVQNPVKKVNSFAHTKETIIKDNIKYISPIGEISKETLNKKTQYQSIIQYCLSIQGMDKPFVNYVKQATAVKKIFDAKYSESDIRFVIQAMGEDQYWHDNTFDLMNVANNMQKYLNRTVYFKKGGSHVTAG
jgi:phage replication O-like protein O